MRNWWPLAVAIVVPGSSLIALGVWLRRRWLAREAAQIETLIRSPRPVFEKLPAKEYDALLGEAARRHAAESYRRKQSAQIASGENLDPPEPLILISGHRR